MKSFGVLTVFSILILIAPQVSAHHSWAAIFDVDGDAEIEGVVSKIVWRNPHIQLQITTDAGTSDAQVYEIESNSVASLTRMGVTKELLAEGTAVRVAGYPSRDGSSAIFMNHLLLPDETELIFLRTAEPRWKGKTIGSADRLHGKVVEDDFSKRPTSIFAVWNTVYGGEGSHRALGAPVEWTEHALAFQKSELEAGRGGPPDRHDCSSRGFRSAFGSPYPIEIIDNGNTIAINAEYFDTYRTIHMKPRAEKPDVPEDGLGYSTGHWMGETLVVETLLYRAGGIDGDDHMKLIETFTLSADHNRLQYTQVTIDPLMRSMPTMAKKWWEYQPDAFVQPYDCSP